MIEVLHPTDEKNEFIDVRLKGLEFFKSKKLTVFLAGPCPRKNYETDLLIMIKAIKQGYIYYGYDGDYDKYEIYHVGIRPLSLYAADGVEDVYMKDYGKTWALTKEELENK